MSSWLLCACATDDAEVDARFADRRARKYVAKLTPKEQLVYREIAGFPALVALRATFQRADSARAAPSTATSSSPSSASTATPTPSASWSSSTSTATARSASSSSSSASRDRDETRRRPRRVRVRALRRRRRRLRQRSRTLRPRPRLPQRQARRAPSRISMERAARKIPSSPTSDDFASDSRTITLRRSTTTRSTTRGAVPAPLRARVRRVV